MSSNMTPPPPPPHHHHPGAPFEKNLHLDSTVGAVEVGAWLAVFLFGLHTCQTYLYYDGRSSRDPKPLRTLIGILWIVECADTGFILQTVWDMTTRDFGNPHRLFGQTTLLGYYVTSLCVHSICPAVQLFYLYRLRQLARNYSLTVLGILLVMARVGFGMTLSAIELSRGIWTTFDDLWLYYMDMILPPITDVLIAFSMCYYLKREREVAMQRTVALLDRLMFWTIQTGLLTSIATVAELIMFLRGRKSSVVWVAPQIAMPKIYTIMLLAVLNARDKLRAMNQDPVTGRIAVNVIVDTVVESDRSSVHVSRLRPGAREYDMEMREEERKSASRMLELHPSESEDTVSKSSSV
ncbi:hypothetical protein PLICRDRAFT_178546 [Plicaturopsis crispa FD-325 SS-3]|nr:hypothetical protein PLICRDRAFT_178546 [Plicaturopsis crispa FD-325 SS-3]